MKKANADVYQKAKDAGVKLWQIADKLNLNDGNFSRRLRKEMPPDEKARIFTIIEELGGGHEQHQ